MLASRSEALLDGAREVIVGYLSRPLALAPVPAASTREKDSQFAERAG